MKALGYGALNLLFVLVFAMAQTPEEIGLYTFYDIEAQRSAMPGDFINVLGCPNDGKADSAIVYLYSAYTVEQAQEGGKEVYTVILQDDRTLAQWSNSPFFASDSDPSSYGLSYDEASNALLDALTAVEIELADLAENEILKLDLFIVESELEFNNNEAARVNSVEAANESMTFTAKHQCGCSWTLETTLGVIEGNEAYFVPFTDVNVENGTTITLAGNEQDITLRVSTDVLPKPGQVQQGHISLGFPYELLNRDIPAQPSGMVSADYDGCAKENVFGCIIEGERPYISFSSMSHLVYPNASQWVMDLPSFAKDDQIIGSAEGEFFMLEQVADVAMGVPQDVYSRHSFKLSFQARLNSLMSIQYNACKLP